MGDSCSYYGSATALFSLFTMPGHPDWRSPQLGALGALAAHWSLPQPVPALLSLPTGTGKTAVAVASAYLACPRRVLVVVPSTELRRQIAEAFRGEEVLLRIGALKRGSGPNVKEVTGLVRCWGELEKADVVVALPNSISPAHHADNLPPASLFDMVIVDEAHHAPAPTWRAILNYFKGARAVLLTATPQRRDGQQVPGKHIYHYPLRQALDEGIFKPVEARVLQCPSGCSREALDQIVAAEVARVLSAPEHKTSTLLIRVADRQRATELAGLYGALNIEVQVLHSGLRDSTQKRIINGLRSREYRAVAVVGMLVEGFDLPSLRVVAYHDKHKSLPATAQLIGRLARVDTRYPQPSILVTVRDIDVYPELQGAVRQLYDEDADWASILPGIIDEEIAEAVANHEYAQAFAPPPPLLSIDAVHPLQRSIIFEIPAQSGVPRLFAGEGLTPELQPGRLLRGNSILYADLNGDANTLLVVTTTSGRPRWHDHPGLDSPIYGLHVVSYRQSAQAQLPSLLFLNTDEHGLGRELLRLIGVNEVVHQADPTRLQEAFDSLDRISVSSVGVRNTYTGRGSPSYKMFAGSGVDRGLREVDTAFGSLGHAMVQVSDPDGPFTAGVSTGKGKYWETRYTSLRTYDAWVTSLAERYWFPPASPTGQLLPQVSRGKRLTVWPVERPLVAILDFALVGTGWVVSDIGPLDALDLRAHQAGSDGTADRLPLELVDLRQEDLPVIWQGYQDLTGNITAAGEDLAVRRGFAGPMLLADLLSERPPTVFFVNGTTVHGATIYDSRAQRRVVPPGVLQPRDWAGADICAETRAAATKRGMGNSIQEELEEHLTGRAPREKHRWILYNHGAGELADYLVLEVGRAGVFLELWHAKSAGGAPSVRVTDMEEVIAQAIKSRRWITDVGIWEQFGARMNGRAAPAMKIIEGSERLLNALCGEDNRWARLSFRRTRPIIRGQVVIAQPGLSQRDLETELHRSSQSAVQIRDLLAVFHDSVSMLAGVTVLCSQ